MSISREGLLRFAAAQKAALAPPEPKPVAKPKPPKSKLSKAKQRVKRSKPRKPPKKATAPPKETFIAFIDNDYGTVRGYLTTTVRPLSRTRFPAERFPTRRVALAEALRWAKQHNITIMRDEIKITSCKK